jgi:hypothetical protein
MGRFLGVNRRVDLRDHGLAYLSLDTGAT